VRSFVAHSNLLFQPEQTMPGSYGSVVSSPVMVHQQASGPCPLGNCIATVPQDEFYSVEKFGEFQRILGPGLTCVGCDCFGLCIGFRSMTRRVAQNDCIVETKTKDNVFVAVKVAVQQSVDPERAEAAIYRLANVSAQVDSYVADVVRSHVPKMLLDEVFERKDSISDEIMEQLARHMTAYGFVIHKALVVEVRPGQDVMDAMNEINKQKRLREAAIVKAEAEKVKVVTAAEAAADAAHLQGQGIARQRSAIVKGLRDSIDEDQDKTLSSERVSELLLMSQYFETLQAIGAQSKSQAIFMPHSPGEVSNISAQIRQGVLEGAFVRGDDAVVVQAKPAQSLMR